MNKPNKPYRPILPQPVCKDKTRQIKIDVIDLFYKYNDPKVKDCDCDEEIDEWLNPSIQDIIDQIPKSIALNEIKLNFNCDSDHNAIFPSATITYNETVDAKKEELRFAAQMASYESDLELFNKQNTNYKEELKAHKSLKKINALNAKKIKLEAELKKLQQL